MRIDNTHVHSATFPSQLMGRGQTGRSGEAAVKLAEEEKGQGQGHVTIRNLPTVENLVLETLVILEIVTLTTVLLLPREPTNR
jgi:hypothetical protein